jgi:hypothetical protein
MSGQEFTLIEDTRLRRERQAIRSACQELEALYTTAAERSSLGRDEVKEIVREVVAGELDEQDVAWGRR